MKAMSAPAPNYKNFNVFVKHKNEKSYLPLHRTEWDIDNKQITYRVCIQAAILQTMCTIAQNKSFAYDAYIQTLAYVADKTVNLNVKIRHELTGFKDVDPDTQLEYFDHDHVYNFLYIVWCGEHESWDGWDEERAIDADLIDPSTLPLHPPMASASLTPEASTAFTQAASSLVGSKRATLKRKRGAAEGAPGGRRSKQKRRRSKSPRTKSKHRSKSKNRRARSKSRG